MTEKRFTIVDDYLIEYDGSYFDLHKPSDIRSLVTVIGYVTDEKEQLRKRIGKIHSKKILEIYDETIEDVADVIAEHLTVSESTFLRWYIEQFKIQFENNLNKSVMCDD